MVAMAASGGSRRLVAGTVTAGSPTTACEPVARALAARDHPARRLEGSGVLLGFGKPAAWHVDESGISGER
jgi:hypothetical protein